MAAPNPMVPAKVLLRIAEAERKRVREVYYSDESVVYLPLRVQRIGERIVIKQAITLPPTVAKWFAVIEHTKRGNLPAANSVEPRMKADDYFAYGYYVGAALQGVDEKEMTDAIKQYQELFARDALRLYQQLDGDFSLDWTEAETECRIKMEAVNSCAAGCGRCANDAKKRKPDNTAQQG